MACETDGALCLSVSVTLLRQTSAVTQSFPHAKQMKRPPRLFQVVFQCVIGKKRLAKQMEHYACLFRIALRNVLDTWRHVFDRFRTRA